MLLFRILVLILLLGNTFSNAQSVREQRLDSLENELKKAIIDTTRVNILCLLTRDYGGIDSIKTFDNGFKALELSKKISYLKGMTDSHIAIGGGYMDYYDLEKAKYHLKKGNEFAEKLIAKNPSKANVKLWMRGHYNLGIAYGYEGDHDTEIELTQKVIPVAEKQGDTKFLANVYTNLAITNSNLARYADAYNSFIKSGELQKKLNKKEDIIFDRLSFANTLLQMDSLNKMKEVLDEAKVFLDEDPGALDWQLYHTAMGTYQTARERYKEAISSYDRAKAILVKNKMYGYLFRLLQRYAFTYEKMGDYKMAGNYMTDFLTTAIETKNGLNTYRGFYKRSQYKAADGNFESAYSDLRKAVDIYDSLEMADTAMKIEKLEIEYETAQKEKEILALKNEQNESALSLEKRKSQAYLLGGIIILLAFLLFMGYIFYRSKLRKARKKERIQEAEVNLLKQEQQNKVFSAMIIGQEKERKRLAIDLHDGLGGRLSGISLNLSKLDKDEPEEYPKKQLQKVIKDLDDSLTELRNIARNMMPETLIKFGLQAALKDYCSSMTSQNTKVTLQFYGSEKGVDPNQQVTIYRVIQELINNAIKHAKASEVLVQYMREGNNVHITVEDNGVGLAKEILEKGGTGMGLSNLRTRVAYLKGELDFHTENNEGTTVNVHITLDAAA